MTPNSVGEHFQQQAYVGQKQAAMKTYDSVNKGHQLTDGHNKYSIAKRSSSTLHIALTNVHTRAHTNPLHLKTNGTCKTNAAIKTFTIMLPANFSQVSVHQSHSIQLHKPR